MLKVFDIDGAITTLDSALFIYSKSQSTAPVAGQPVIDPVAALHSVQTAFAPIADYYSNLTGISNDLQLFLENASKYVVDSQDRLENEERYENRIHPEESVEARELFLGIVPTLRIQTMPYLLATGVFMALMTIFLIFQMIGVTGQIHLPPAVVQWWMTPATGPPFYKNPMVLGGAIIVLIAAVIILYFKAKRNDA